MKPLRCDFFTACANLHTMLKINSHKRGNSERKYHERTELNHAEHANLFIKSDICNIISTE